MHGTITNTLTPEITAQVKSNEIFVVTVDNESGFFHVLCTSLKDAQGAIAHYGTAVKGYSNNVTVEPEAEEVESYQGRATMILLNTLGFPIVRQINLKKAKVERDRFGKTTLTVWYTEKGKRKQHGTKFSENSVAIAKGWQEVQGTLKDGGEHWTFEEGKFENMLSQLKAVMYTQKR